MTFTSVATRDQPTGPGYNMQLVCHMQNSYNVGQFGNSCAHELSRELRCGRDESTAESIYELNIHLGLGLT